MKQTNTRAMVETAFLTTIVVLLTLVGTSVPILSLLATLVAPAGIALVGIRWGSRYSCASSIVAFILVSMLMGPLLSMSTVLVYSLPSIFLGEAFRANWSFSKLITIPTIALCIATALGFIVSAGLTSFDLSRLTDMVDVDLKNMFIESIRQQQLPQEQMDAYIQQIDIAIDQAKRMLVAYWFSANAVVVYIMARFISFLAKRTNVTIPQMPAISTWRLPIWGAGILAIGLILVYGLSYLQINNDLVTTIGMNIALLGGFICGLNGIACLLSLLNAYNIGRIFKVLIIVFLYFMSPLSLVVFGIMDMFLDLRSRYERRGQQ